MKDLNVVGKSKIYVETGPREMQLYARIGTDGLIMVLELDTDCPERVFTYFMRGGIEDGSMHPKEFQDAALAVNELLTRAKELWPGWFKRKADE